MVTVPVLAKGVSRPTRPPPCLIVTVPVLLNDVIVVKLNSLVTTKVPWLTKLPESSMAPKPPTSTVPLFSVPLARVMVPPSESLTSSSPTGSCRRGWRLSS